MLNTSCIFMVNYPRYAITTSTKTVSYLIWNLRLHLILFIRERIFYLKFSRYHFVFMINDALAEKSFLIISLFICSKLLMVQYSLSVWHKAIVSCYAENLEILNFLRISFKTNYAMSNKFYQFFDLVPINSRYSS